MSLTIPIALFIATDDVGVTGYRVTESTSTPVAEDPGWSSSPPQNYSFTSIGEKTLYAWARDAAGNVSLGVSATTTISVPTDVPIWQFGSENGSNSQKRVRDITIPSPSS